MKQEYVLQYQVERCPEIEIIVLTTNKDLRYDNIVNKIGASDSLIKSIRRTDLTDTVMNLRNEIQQENIVKDEYVRAGERKLDICEDRIKEIGYKIHTEKNIYIKNKNNKVSEVIGYIHNNITDPNLSLSNAAKEFYLNPSYLSRVFKQEIGITFVGYITGIRIEMALYLFRETDLKGYEVGDKIGIPDPSYFGKCFKKYMGISVNDYKKSK